MKLEDKIDSLLGQDTFIVSVNEISRQNLVRLIVDAERHISLDETADIAKKIRDSKDIRSMFPDGLRIEVSTPGVTAPLEYDFQYKNTSLRAMLICFHTCFSSSSVIANSSSSISFILIAMPSAINAKPKA